MPTDLDAVVDLVRYPLDRRDPWRLEALFEQARAEFAASGVLVLREFLRPEALVGIAADALANGLLDSYRFTDLEAARPTAPEWTSDARARRAESGRRLGGSTGLRRSVPGIVGRRLGGSTGVRRSVEAAEIPRRGAPRPAGGADTGRDSTGLGHGAGIAHDGAATAHGASRGDHPSPVRTGLPSAEWILAHDRIPEGSPVKRLYRWEPLLDFVSRVAGEPVYRSADDLGALTVHVHEEGDGRVWGVAQSDYTVALHITAPALGGIFEFESPARAFVERGGGHPDRRRRGVDALPTTPGTLVLYAGRRAGHRVTRVRGNGSRVVAELSFNSRPGLRLNDHQRLRLFGRAR
ncbi:hypothetical protein [Nocardia jejuensis]|uniref:hypothetical protein n=1 Tax=Nocardia jejuensis TaxID=328049 RepID=UPI0008352A44|nr:hypothetical protein [Nocardia jejuensis]